MRRLLSLVMAKHIGQVMTLELATSMAKEFLGVAKQTLLSEDEAAVQALSSIQGALTPEKVEAALLELPQAECPLIHRFGPGIYIRELHMKAGTFAVGHRQRFEHTNLLLQGRVLMVNEDGSTKELAAPLFFIGQPGRKVGHVLEDVVWQNIYATTERDIDKLEAMFIDKSESWQASDSARRQMAQSLHQADRDDYLHLLQEFGIEHATALAQSENQDDQTELPPGYEAIRIADSAIQGQGLFTTYPVEPGTVIAPARLAGKRTLAGRYTNHSWAPNAMMVPLPNGDINLVATQRIAGCTGGGIGEEITIDYRQALGLAGLIPKELNPCQQLQ